MGRVLFLLLCLACVGVSGYAIAAYSLFPVGSTVHPRMRETFDAHRVGIYTHVFASAVTLLIGPLQFIAALRNARPRLHRALGRIYLCLGVGLGGVAGLYMSLFAFGGLVSSLGFASLASLWLYTGWHAYAAARARRFVEHRDWMVRNFALALAAVTLRIYLSSGLIIGVSFDLLYPALAWLCWVPNILIAEWGLRFFSRSGSAPPCR